VLAYRSRIQLLIKLTLRPVLNFLMFFQLSPVCHKLKLSSALSPPKPITSRFTASQPLIHQLIPPGLYFALSSIFISAGAHICIEHNTSLALAYLLWSYSHQRKERTGHALYTIASTQSSDLETNIKQRIHRIAYTTLYYIRLPESRLRKPFPLRITLKDLHFISLAVYYYRR